MQKYLMLLKNNDSRKFPFFSLLDGTQYHAVTVWPKIIRVSWSSTDVLGTIGCVGNVKR